MLANRLIGKSANRSKALSKIDHGNSAKSGSWQIGEAGGGVPNSATPRSPLENLPYAGLARPQNADQPPPQVAAAADTQGDPWAFFSEALAHEKASPPAPRVAREGFRIDDRGRHVFAPGNKHTPDTKGRKGSRNKLATSFFNDMYELWEEQGQAVLRQAAFQDPVAFAAIVAKLMPQKIEVSDTTMQDMENDRLERLVEFAERHLAIAGPPDEGGAGGVAGEGEGGIAAPGGVGAIEILPPLRKAT
jgi:hypothetical protein